MSAILCVVAASYILLVLFWAVMALRWRWNSLPLDMKILAAPCVVIALLMDVAFNFTFACLLFLKLPARGEWTFSQRIGNYKRRVDWRAPVAAFLCKRLDVFEVYGAHCKQG